MKTALNNKTDALATDMLSAWETILNALEPLTAKGFIFAWPADIRTPIMNQAR